MLLIIMFMIHMLQLARPFAKENFGLFEELFADD